MTVFHDFKRTKDSTHDLFGPLHFQLNEAGHAVCDVTDQRAIDRLLELPEIFCVYADQPEAPLSPLLTQDPAKTTDEVATLPAIDRYLLVHGETTFDLKPLTDEALRAFAEANGIKVHHAAKGDSIRDKIVAALAIEV